MDGEFTLMVNSPIYLTKTAAKGHFIDTRTGENVGQTVDLHIILCDGTNILPEPVYEEDFYELVDE